MDAPRGLVQRDTIKISQIHTRATVLTWKSFGCKIHGPRLSLVWMGFPGFLNNESGLLFIEGLSGPRDQRILVGTVFDAIHRPGEAETVRGPCRGKQMQGYSGQRPLTDQLA